MTPNELATFLRERLPKIAPLVRLGAATGPKETGLASIEAQELVNALDTAVGLLREAEQALAYIQRRTNVLYRGEEKLLATLRLVVGAGGGKEGG